MLKSEVSLDILWGHTANIKALGYNNPKMEYKITDCLYICKYQDKRCFDTMDVKSLIVNLNAKTEASFHIL